MKPGCVGVLTCDDNASLYRFIEDMGNGYGWFSPINNPRLRIENKLSDFWVLLDDF